MTRRICDALVERGEVARALGYMVSIRAAPDPALVITLQKIPVQIRPFVQSL
jgi:hypothetical protein